MEPKSLEETQEDYLAEVGNSLRDMWCKEYSLYHASRGINKVFPGNVMVDGGTGSNGKKYKRKWEEYAQIIITSGVPLSAAVRTVWHSSYPNKYPNALINREILAKARTLAYQEPEQIRLSLSLQASIFSAKTQQRAKLYETLDQARTSVLCDPSVELSALFRYSVARSLGLSEVSILWEGEAITQYSTNMSVYDQLWTFLIPEDFKESARFLCSFTSESKKSKRNR